MAKINQRTEFKLSFSTHCHIKKKKKTAADAQQKTESILWENALVPLVMGKHSSQAKL